MFRFNSTAKGGTAGGRADNTKHKPVELVILAACLPWRRASSLCYLHAALAATTSMLKGW